MKLWVKCRRCGTVKQVNVQKAVASAIRTHAVASPGCGITYGEMLTGSVFELLDADPNKKELITNPAARL